jgi:succinate dehydrogenase/fumarate reductase iron-sulfur protein
MAKRKLKEKATVKVYRYDPSTQKEPYYDTYEVPFDEQNSVLQVLTDIREQQDPTLAVRESCWVGCCLICTFRVNGRSKVTCRTRMEKEMVIEPLKKERVVRDLIQLERMDVDDGRDEVEEED